MIVEYLSAIRASLGNSSIHPTAIVSPKAQLGKNVNVGPYSVIGNHVQIDDDVWIDSHVSIQGRTTIGKRSTIWAFASLGASPQDLKFRGEDATLIIGEDNAIREYVNISIGTSGGGNVTKIGHRNLMMVHTHIGHDCQIADDCIFANGVSLGGHVTVEQGAVLGGHSGVHQFCKIGKLAMAAGGAIIVQDVAPYSSVQGDRATVNGLNLTGLKRAGYSDDAIHSIKLMYKLVFRSNLTVDRAIAQICEQIIPSDIRDHYVEFIKSCTRGICR